MIETSLKYPVEDVGLYQGGDVIESHQLGDVVDQLSWPSPTLKTRYFVVGLLPIDKQFLQKRTMFFTVWPRSLDRSREVRSGPTNRSYSGLLLRRVSNYNFALITALICLIRLFVYQTADIYM